jgi:cytochrome c biogenesis protein CcmG/thiol:disulfide interchange protein DsbE
VSARWGSIAMTGKLCVLLLGLMPLFAVAQDPAPPSGIIRLDGRAAPSLVLADMDGNSTDLAKLRGKWVLVHFWAGWCGPCRREMPTLQQLHQQFQDERFRLVLVNTAETDDEVFAFLPTVAPELNTLMDRDGLVTERWQPRGLPSSFLVDPAGRLRFLALGGRNWVSPAYLSFLRVLIATQ